MTSRKFEWFLAIKPQTNLRRPCHEENTEKSKRGNRKERLVAYEAMKNWNFKENIIKVA